MATMANSMKVHQEIENRLPYDPAIPVLGIYPQATNHYPEATSVLPYS